MTEEAEHALSGRVYLVGAGPGDPGLLTVRGKECLERADVVVYDALANPELLRHAPKAEHIFVGKSPDRHTLLQDEINRVLIEQARRNQRVVRLKGGDPFVFGRGAEEALALTAAGIPFEVVPGVPAGIAAPAYAGIPVTHRDMAHACTFLTGHDESLDLREARDAGTIVVYMPIKNIRTVVRQLIEMGRPGDTPAALVQWGTLPAQKTAFARLDAIADACQHEAIESPAVLIVGPVTALHSQLAWFENRPLFGKRIVVTRAQTQAGKLVSALRERGADVFEFPTIQIEPTDIEEPAIDVRAYDWIVLTSVNAVEMLFRRMDAAGYDARSIAGVKLCVIGSATAEAVRARFLNIDLMPEQYVAEALMAALEAHEPALAGKRFLLPRADIARSFLPTELRARGALVTELAAYRTTVPDTSDALADTLLKYQPDLVTFTSSSTVRNFCTILGPERIETLKQSARFASIGPLTSQTAQELGLTISIEPEQHDIPSFVLAIVGASRNIRH